MLPCKNRVNTHVGWWEVEPDSDTERKTDEENTENKQAWSKSTAWVKSLDLLSQGDIGGSDGSGVWWLWGRGISVVKALGHSSEGHEFMPQHCQTATIGRLSNLLCSRGTVSRQTLCSDPNFLTSWNMQREKFYYMCVSCDDKGFLLFSVFFFFLLSTICRKSGACRHHL